MEFSNVNIGNIHIPGQAAVPASTYLTVQKSLFQFHNRGIEPHGSLQKGKEPDPDPGGGDPPCWAWHSPWDAASRKTAWRSSPVWSHRPPAAINQQVEVQLCTQKGHHETQAFTRPTLSQLTWRNYTFLLSEHVRQLHFSSLRMSLKASVLPKALQIPPGASDNRRFYLVHNPMQFSVLSTAQIPYKLY